MTHVPEHIEALGDDFVRLWHEFTVFPTREEVFTKIRIYKPRTLANLDCQGRGPGGHRQEDGPSLPGYPPLHRRSRGRGTGTRRRE